MFLPHWMLLYSNFNFWYLLKNNRKKREDWWGLTFQDFKWQYLSCENSVCTKIWRFCSEPLEKTVDQISKIIWLSLYDRSLRTPIFLNGMTFKWPEKKEEVLTFLTSYVSLRPTVEPLISGQHREKVFCPLIRGVLLLEGFVFWAQILEFDPKVKVYVFKGHQKKTLFDRKNL